MGDVGNHTLDLPNIVIQQGVNPHEWNSKLDTFSKSRGCTSFLPQVVQIPTRKLRCPEISAPTKFPELDPKQCLVGRRCLDQRTAVPAVLPSVKTQWGKANPMKRRDTGTSSIESLKVVPTPLLHPKPPVMQHPQPFQPAGTSKVHGRAVTFTAQKLQSSTSSPLMVSGVHIRPPAEPRPKKSLNQSRNFAFYQAYESLPEKQLSTDRHDFQAEGSPEVQNKDQISEPKMDQVHPVLGRSIMIVKRCSPIRPKYTNGLGHVPVSRTGW